MANRYSKAEFIDQWEAAQLEVQDLIQRGIKLANLMPSLYEGVLGEDAPEHEEIVERRVERRLRRVS